MIDPKLKTANNLPFFGSHRWFRLLLAFACLTSARAALWSDEVPKAVNDALTALSKMPPECSNKFWNHALKRVTEQVLPRSLNPSGILEAPRDDMSQVSTGLASSDRLEDSTKPDEQLNPILSHPSSIEHSTKPVAEVDNDSTVVASQASVGRASSNKPEDSTEEHEQHNPILGAPSSIDHSTMLVAGVDHYLTVIRASEHSFKMRGLLGGFFLAGPPQWKMGISQRAYHSVWANRLWESLHGLTKTLPAQDLDQVIEFCTQDIPKWVAEWRGIEGRVEKLAKTFHILLTSLAALPLDDEEIDGVFVQLEGRLDIDKMFPSETTPWTTKWVAIARSHYDEAIKPLRAEETFKNAFFDERPLRVPLTHVHALKMSIFNVVIGEQPDASASGTMERLESFGPIFISHLRLFYKHYVSEQYRYKSYNLDSLV
ncbi:hypothetical protein CROQUDRAFT_102023 [Cronartium quercuum f. sp. fusiforme G11]|uniref:Uncharacterized protein n=1 Tax=Cronartium quercuum f. sp. fusiforme G11 TaxID=708437 RepID=A0A9P6N7M3_9BASI|nr:hypothetical protein CROQUDRAFT_102023 [Cronartium quercuum f. sp. fusiforme G11]